MSASSTNPVEGALDQSLRELPEQPILRREIRTPLGKGDLAKDFVASTIRIKGGAAPHGLRRKFVRTGGGGKTMVWGTSGRPGWMV